MATTGTRVEEREAIATAVQLYVDGASKGDPAKLEEIVTAIEAVRSVSSLPIVACLTFDEDAETFAGVSAHDAAQALSRLDLTAIGANHGQGVQAALAALEAMGRDGLPLAALPNVGLASLAGGRVIYPHATPAYFAEFAAHARELGARLIGGCCGTTPTEIAAIKQAVVENRRPTAPRVRRDVLIGGARGIATAEAFGTPTIHSDEVQTQLERLLAAREFVVSVELDPPKGSNAESMLAVARRLKESGRVHVVDINDNPMARARMNALIASAMIEREVGLETIPHVTPRDTSIMGLQSMLLGAQAEGVRNILSVTGDPPHVGDYPGSNGVYDVDSIGLTQILAHLNRGEDFNGKTIDAPTSFFVGVAVNPSADDVDDELARFERKLEAGARFAMTQALFDLSFLEHFGGRSPIPLLVGVFYVRSYQLALRLHNEVPGIVVPEHVQERFRRAGTTAPEVGQELARELIADARELAAGVYVIPPFKQPDAALDLL